MIEAKALPLDRICSHQLPLEDFRDGLELVGRGADSVKVSLLPG
jgi:erythritol/L-threitol dehydrogenase